MPQSVAIVCRIPQKAFPCERTEIAVAESEFFPGISRMLRLIGGKDLILQFCQLTLNVFYSLTDITCSTDKASSCSGEKAVFSIAFS
jgi:hypothetical protein